MRTNPISLSTRYNLHIYSIVYIDQALLIYSEFIIIQQE